MFKKKKVIVEFIELYTSQPQKQIFNFITPPRKNNPMLITLCFFGSSNDKRAHFPVNSKKYRRCDFKQFHGIHSGSYLRIYFIQDKDFHFDT